MIKVKRDKDGKVDTKIQGKALDIIEELLNATVAIIAMLVAVALYALAVVVLKIFTKEEIKMLPAGDKIVRILEKIKIY